VTVYLVRHARAGSRGRWRGDDALRPLSKVGKAQANGIAKRLARKPIETVVSSPYLRCVGTVTPLAERRKLDVETSDALAEGARLSQALRLFEKVQDREAVLCTHGDVMEDLLDHFGRHGVKLRDHRMEKGSIWVFDIGRGGVEKARYLPPPKST
jgi:broad specificity phosphatase PhoE